MPALRTPVVLRAWPRAGRPVLRWQNRLPPMWKPLAGGFALGELEAGYLSGPKPMIYLYRGWADAS